MRIAVARICHGKSEHTAVGTWLAHATLAAHKDARISYFTEFVIDDFPTTIARNKAALAAQRIIKADVLFMLDHDNAPDANFFEHAINWLEHHPSGVIASPYCGPRAPLPGAPDREVLVVIDDAGSLRKVTREEARTLRGIRPAIGVPTGVIAIGIPAFDKVSLPWFDYEYADPHCSVLQKTDDFYFSFKAVAAGVEVVCDWDCFAGHVKSEMILRPE
jgi:hypothetical protein